MLDRALGEYRLPDGWTVFAAGNREGDRAVTSRMSSALSNRFVQLSYELDLGDWSRWATGQADLRPKAVAFPRWGPDLLHRFEPTGKAFSSPARGPRSCAFSPPPRWPTTSSPGSRLFRSQPSLDGVLLNPATAPVPDEPSALGVIVFPGSAISQRESRRQSPSARHPGVAVQRARVDRKGA